MKLYIVLIVIYSILAFITSYLIFYKHKQKHKHEFFFTNKNGLIDVILYDDNGNPRHNRIEAPIELRDARLVKRKGVLVYELDAAENEQLMEKFFPEYTGTTIPLVRVDSCVMLSVDIKKYESARDATLANLRRYVLPPVRVHLGYTSKNMHNSPYYSLMQDPVKYRAELTLGMLDIFTEFVSEHESGWLLYFEDDVRPVNVPDGTDFSVLRNIPVDAELIRPIIGRDEDVDIDSVKYRHSYGGGNNHGFYISVSGCKKVLKYVKENGWRFYADIDLYKIARGCGQFPTGLDGWTFLNSEGANDISPLLAEEDKIVMYHMSHILFDQTSLPISRAFKK